MSNGARQAMGAPRRLGRSAQAPLGVLESDGAHAGRCLTLCESPQVRAGVAGIGRGRARDAETYFPGVSMTMGGAAGAAGSQSGRTAQRGGAASPIDEAKFGGSGADGRRTERRSRTRRHVAAGASGQSGRTWDRSRPPIGQGPRSRRSPPALAWAANSSPPSCFYRLSSLSPAIHGVPSPLLVARRALPPRHPSQAQCLSFASSP